ncbi:MAG TPA: hypothetical protein VIV40_18935 [Kofleriaceae bacterium]
MVRFLVLASVILCAGWDYVEHLSLGNESYRHACDDLRTELGSSTDSALRTRLEIACDNLDIAAQLYGQATALAGDRFGGPADFLSTRAGWKVASRKQYYSLALANTTHFHPYATREWRRYHSQAITEAIEASKKVGLDAVDGLQVALFESAFADHFLHDAFSSGHMGFNRAASSVAASLVYHDRWNAKGRVIRDRLGRSWKTYGDGHLELPANADGRAHAARVATLSIEGVLRAFVLGTRDPNHELEIWRALPYVIDAPELPSLTDRILGVGAGDSSALHPLEAIDWPAHKDRVVDLTALVTGSFTSAPTTALLVGYHVSLPLVSAPIHVGVGATLPHDTLGAHFAGAAGVTAPLGLTGGGILDHHLCAGALWEVRYQTVAGSIWAGYLVNVELGRNLVQLQFGPAFVAPEKEFGFAVSLGVARVLSAAGGGVR